MSDNETQPSGPQADNLQRVEEGCLSQLRLEGKITIEGVMQHARIGSRNTVQKYLEEAREKILSQLRYLTVVAEDQDFPVEALAELRRWSVDKAERSLEDQQAQLDKDRQNFDLRQKSALQEQQDLRDQINTHKNESERWREKHEQETQAHQSTKDIAKQQVAELKADLTQVNNELEAERGKLTAEQEHASDLANEIAILKEALKEADQVKEERDKQQVTIENLKRGVDLATQTMTDLRERLKEQEHNYQVRESAWLSDREKMVVSMHDAQSERDRALASMAELEKRYTELQTQSHQARDEHRQATTSLSEQVATLKAQLAGKQETVERLEKQVDRNESKLEAISKENRVLNRDNSALNQHLQAISGKKP